MGDATTGEMDGYWLGKMFFEACSDPAQVLVNAFKADPATAVDRFPMSARSRQAVLDRDLRTIYEAGLHPLLVRMGANALYGPMPQAAYREALAGAVQVEY
jgi:hypothetical protein